MMLAVLLMMAVAQDEARTPGVCASGPAEALIGERYRRGVPTRAKRLSGAARVRVLMPGEVTTQEFREDRLTLRVDYRRVITAVRCG